MEDQIELSDFCADLVSLKRFEPFVSLLLQQEGAKWFTVADLTAAAGLARTNVEMLGPDLFVTWLDDPSGSKDYVILLFYDRDSKWSMAAEYNRERLFPGD